MENMPHTTGFMFTHAIHDWKQWYSRSKNKMIVRWHGLYRIWSILFYHFNILKKNWPYFILKNHKEIFHTKYQVGNICPYELEFSSILWDTWSLLSTYNLDIFHQKPAGSEWRWQQFLTVCKRYASPLPTFRPRALSQLTLIYSPDWPLPSSTMSKICCKEYTVWDFEGKVVCTKT